MGRLQLGLDDIPAEAEADRDSCQHVIKHAIQTFQQDPRGGGSIGPVHWTKGSIIKLLKKTDLSECSNYRGTMLQSTPGKVLNTFLLETVKEVVNPKLLRPSLTVDGTNPVSTRSSAWSGTPPFINLIYYEKYEDSVKSLRETRGTKESPKRASPSSSAPTRT